MSRTKLIKVQSQHDSKHVNHSRFSFNLGMVDPDLHKVTSVILVGAVIPNKQYNVNSTNNVLRYNLNGAGVASLTVPVGQYTTTTLMAYLQANIAGTTWTQDATTQIINIATTNTLDIESETSDVLSTLSPVLGINTALTIGGASNDDAEDIPDLNGTDLFLIESQTLAGNNMVSSLPNLAPMNKNVIAVVPVDVFFGSNQVWSDQGNLEQSRVTYSQPKNITNIDIKITDQNHNSLNLMSPCTLIFRVYF